MKTGKIYLIAFQAAAVLTVPLVFTAAGYTAILTKRSVLSFLFELGFAAMPQAEALALSALYRLTGSEMLVTLIPLAIAFAYGVLAERIFKLKYAYEAVAALIACDLILRIFVGAPFGVWAALLGALVRAASLALIILEIRRKRNDLRNQG